MVKKILIIDDDISYLELTKVMLERNSYSVFLAENGKDGIEKAESSLPDLIFLDIMMPEMSGIEVLQALKSSQKAGHIPVIMLTAKSDSRTMIKTQDLGAADYIIKPYDGKELLEIIKIY